MLAFHLLGPLGCGTDPADDTAPGDDDTIPTDDDSAWPPLDADGDGLTDAEEGALGTDPESADTDADRYDDGVEVAAETDPLEYYQHPFIGGYPPGPGPTWHGTGWTVGDVLDNQSLLDQHGEAVDLWAFSGWGQLLIFGAPW